MHIYQLFSENNCMIAHVLCTQENTLAKILLLEKVENKRPTLEQKENRFIFVQSAQIRPNLFFPSASQIQYPCINIP